jgi:uncharacterized protein YhaN
VAAHAHLHPGASNVIISRLDLQAFGRFTDVSIDLSIDASVSPDAGHRPRRLHLIYGPNESGKSTSLRAITAWLFGIPGTDDDNYLHSNSQIRVGGLLVDDHGQTLECIRRRGRKATLRGADDNEPIDESRLQSMLGGMDRETFLTRFGLSHGELVAGGAAILSGEGDLGQILFAAGAGVGKLREIQAQLDADAKALFTPRASKPAINTGLRELEEKRKELRQAQAPPAEFSSLCERLDARRAASAQLGEQLQAALVAISRLRSQAQALPLLPQWRSSAEAMQASASTPILDEAFIERRRQAAAERELAIHRRSELEQQIAELKIRLDRLPADTLVMQYESEIQAVFQEVASREKAGRERVELIREQRETDRKIVDLLRELSVEIGSHDDRQRAEAIDQSVQRLRLSDTLRTRIRQLAQAYPRWITSRDEAHQAMETTRRRLADVVAELEVIGTPGDPAVLSSAIDAVGDPHLMLDAIQQCQQSHDACLRRGEDLLRRLSGFHGTLQQAARLRPPAEAATVRHVEALRTSAQQLQDAESYLRRLRSERDGIAEQLRQQQADAPLPTQEELTAARQQRDRELDQLALQAGGGGEFPTAARPGQSPLCDVIERLRHGVHITDQLADTMRAHHQQVHQRAALGSRLSALDPQLSAADAALVIARQQSHVSQQQWLELWENVGVTPDQPEQMQRWLADHERLCEVVSQLASEQQRWEQAQSRVDRAAVRLCGILRTAASIQPVSVSAVPQGELFDEPATADLLTLYDQALALRSELARASQQHAALARRRKELADELPAAETRLATAQRAVEQWQSDWLSATESFVQSGPAGTEEVMQMLEQIGELCSQKRERDRLAAQIRSIGEDELAYAARVHRVAAASGNMPQLRQADAAGAAINQEAALHPTAIAHMLYRRLQAERTAQRDRQSFREQIDTAEQKLRDVTARRSACEVVLKQLCSEAGCQSADELPGIERASRQRLALQAARRDLENQLALLASDQPLDEFIAAAGTKQPAILQAEIEQKEAELQQLRAQIAAVEQAIGALQHEIKSMDGSSKASELSQSIELIAGQISHDARQYARTRIAAWMLQLAIDHYRQANQSPVLARANRFFQQLTCGQYVELRPDYDAAGRTTLLGIRADGVTEVPVGAMSTGTADALYLALRLASLQHQTSHGISIPLIIDDCLVQLDDDRAAAALQALSELSETTQVILFTHHWHIVALARQRLGDGEFHLHRLE